MVALGRRNVSYEQGTPEGLPEVGGFGAGGLSEPDRVARRWALEPLMVILS